MQIGMIDNLNANAATQAKTATGAVLADRRDPQFVAMLKKADDNVQKLADKIVASTFFMPVLTMIREDPMKSELFHGGFAEEVFGQQLDTVIADRMAAKTTLGVTEKLRNNIMNNIRHDVGKVHDAATMRVDVFG